MGQAKVQTVKEEELDENQNMFEKGQEMIGDTFNKFNDNLNNFNKDLSKRKGGLFQLPSLEALMPTNPENPLMKLKAKLFPTEQAFPDRPIPKSTEAPQLNFEPNVFADNFAEKLAIQSWNFMTENEDASKQLSEQAWRQNTEFEDDSLPFLFE